MRYSWKSLRYPMKRCMATVSISRAPVCVMYVDGGEVHQYNMQEQAAIAHKPNNTTESNACTVGSVE